MKLLNFRQVKLIILIAGLAYSAINLAAVRVVAQILNSADKPIEDVTVTDGYKRVFTNINGYFTITTESDSLILSKLGYTRQTLSVKTIPAIISLREKPIVLDKVRVVERYDIGSSALDKTALSSDAEGGISNPAELLLQDSSVQSASTKLMGESQTLSLLGNLSRHTLVMLDNVPLNPQGEAFDLASLPLDAIRRIEIVKGNASLYGGASAIGGIVYLYTNDVNVPAPLSLKWETAFGSFRQFRQSYAYEQQSPALSYRVAVSRLTADNDFQYQPRPWWDIPGEFIRENNRKQQQGISLKLSSSPDKINWAYSLDAEQLYRQLPGPVNFLDIYKNAYLTGQNLRQNLSLSYQSARLANSLLFWQNEDNTAYNNTQAANPVYLAMYRQNHTSRGLKTQSQYSFEPAEVSLGLELSQQNYERRDLLYPNLSIGKTGRNQGAVSLKANLESQSQWLTNNLQAGIRVDEVTDFGAFTSWRIENVVKTDTAVQLQTGATLGSSFSLPSFYDLYWKGDAQSLGNPELEPETSLGGSIWTGAGFEEYSIKASYYQSEVKQLIQWRQTYLYGTAWKPLNIGKAALQNWEIEIKAKPLSWLTLNSSLTLTKAKDKTNSNDYFLTYTPDQRWVADIVFSQRGFTVNLNLDYTGRQWTTPDNLIDPVPSVTQFGSYFKYGYHYKRLSSDICLQLNNLFDKQYEIYAYVPQPGFNWLCGINLRYEM
jgi:outer membrane cobalamin receptor